MAFEKVISLIQEKNYQKAINEYYNELGDHFFGPYHRELLYLKQLADIPLCGNDILFFRQGSRLTSFLKSNLREYSLCIDNILMEWKRLGIKSPLEILNENTKTLEELVMDLNKKKPAGGVLRQRLFTWEVINQKTGKMEISNSYLSNGFEKTRLSEDFFHNTIDRIISFEQKHFSFDDVIDYYYIFPNTRKGYLFDVYPDQILNSRVMDIPVNKKLFKVWTTFPPKLYKEEFTEKNIDLSAITVFSHVGWRMSKREPDFSSIQSYSDLHAVDYHNIDRLEFTGRDFNFDGTQFFEVNLYRSDPDRKKIISSPFLECIDELLRDGENRLRKLHGLPQIGEGWVSEVEVYNLVKEKYPDAVFHAMPKWLAPQHLDIFVPSKKFAIEYQGQQHYEPVIYFGGEESYFKNMERDLRKAEKCRINKIKLIYWNYNEKITIDNFISKLKQLGEKI